MLTLQERGIIFGMEENRSSTNKGLIQFLKFNLVSFGVTIIQLLLVNVFLYLMRNWNTPLPGLLSRIFSEEAVGAGNSNWGYVLPFFLSNVIANILGYFQNRKTTFNSDSPKRNVLIFFAVITILICFSTWLQGRTAFLITEHLPQISKAAPTLAALLAGAVQFAVVFPLEKYVLLRERRERKES